MKNVFALLSLAIGFLWVYSATAEELRSGPQPGDFVEAFEVEKSAGNEKDGVSEGQQLCYRCKLGSRPVVAVFARTADKSLSNLLKELDAVLAKNESKKLSSFVNLLGTDTKALKASAREIVASSGAKNIAVVIPADHENGPAEYRLNPKADVTVLVYKAGTVTANFALAQGELDKDAIEKITNAATSLVN